MAVKESVPTSPEAEKLKAKGNAQLKAKSYSEALGSYCKALDLLGKRGPKDPHIVLRLAVNLNAALACLYLEEWDKAEGYATEAIRANPKSTKALYRRGLARLHLEALKDDARSDFEKAIKLQPTGEAAVQIKAELEKLEGEADESKYVVPATASTADAAAYEKENNLRKRRGEARMAWAKWKSTAVQQAEFETKGKEWCAKLRQIAKQAGRLNDSSKAACSAMNDNIHKMLPKVGKVNTLAFNQACTAAHQPAPATYAFAQEEETGKPSFLAPGPWPFDGKSSQDVAYDPRTNPSGNFSVELWARCIAGKGHQSPLTSRNQDSNGRCRAGYMFYLEPEGLWSFWVGCGQRWVKLYGPKVKPREWTRLRGVVDVDGRVARFYVDDELVHEQMHVDFVQNKTQPLRIGAGCSESSTARFGFIGEVKDVAIFEGDVEMSSVQNLASWYAKNAPKSWAKGLHPSEMEITSSKQIGSSGQPAVTAALCWCATTELVGGVPPVLPSITVPATVAREDFHTITEEFLRVGASSIKDNMVRTLQLVADIQAHPKLSNGGEELQLVYGKNPNAINVSILQFEGVYRLLYEVQGICKVEDTLRRQDQMRSGMNGWITQRDITMWMTAFEMLLFSTEPEEVENAANTVFTFGYWTEEDFLSPRVLLVDFPVLGRHQRPRIGACMTGPKPLEEFQSAVQKLSAA